MAPIKAVLLLYSSPVAVFSHCQYRPTYVLNVGVRSSTAATSSDRKMVCAIYVYLILKPNAL
jgi:hypothetical protein